MTVRTIIDFRILNFYFLVFQDKMKYTKDNAEEGFLKGGNRA